MNFKIVLGVIFIILISISTAGAVVIQRDVTNLGGNTFRFEYYVTVDDPSVGGVTDVSISFSPTQYTNINPGCVIDWSCLPSNPLPDFNSYPWVSIGTWDNTIDERPPVFSSEGPVLFTFLEVDYLGVSDEPLFQFFEARTTNAGLITGATSGSPLPPLIDVPEPSTIGLLGIALCFLGLGSRKKIS